MTDRPDRVVGEKLLRQARHGKRETLIPKYDDVLLADVSPNL